MHTGESLYILAQTAAGGGRDLKPYLVAVGVLIIVVVLAGLVLVVLRSRLYGDSADGDLDAGGVLETMRAMRDRGEISEEEYRTAQAAIVAKAARAENPEADRGHPARAQTRAALPGELRAEPGFDLTGAPLPPAVRDRDGGSSGASR